MENTTADTHTSVNPKSSPHMLYLIAAVAVILVSVAGIAAFMGWIPSSTADPSDRSGTDKQSSAAPKAASPSRSAATVAQAQCPSCGEIVSIREIVTPGTGSGLGAVGGAVVGGVLGNQVGKGKGKDAATVIGVVGGAVAGNEIEKKTKSSTSYEITVRLENGTTRVVTQSSPPTWRTGDRVKVVDGVLHSNG